MAGAVRVGLVPCDGEAPSRHGNGARHAKEAEREYATIRHRLATGTFVEPSKETVGAFLMRWLNDHAKTRVAQGTYRRYEQSVRVHLLPTLSQVPLVQLRPAHVVAAMQRWRETPSRRGGTITEGTVLNSFRVLREALACAVRWQVLPTNPADAVDQPRPRRPEMRFLTEEQTVDLLDAVSASEDRALFTVAILTGMRVGELLGLRWRDVDLESGCIRVTRSLTGSVSAPSFGAAKTHRSRRGIELDAALVERLQQHRAAQATQRLAAGLAWGGHDLVFTDAIGRPLGRKRVGNGLRAALERAGLPHMRVHDLRHTHATLLLASGENPRLVAERLGHSRVAFTLDVYGHVAPGQQRGASERLAARLGRRRELMG